MDRLRQLVSDALSASGPSLEQLAERIGTTEARQQQLSADVAEADRDYVRAISSADENAIARTNKRRETLHAQLAAAGRELEILRTSRALLTQDEERARQLEREQRVRDCMAARVAPAEEIHKLAAALAEAIQRFIATNDASIEAFVSAHGRRPEAVDLMTWPGIRLMVDRQLYIGTNGKWTPARNFDSVWEAARRPDIVEMVKREVPLLDTPSLPPTREDRAP